MKVLYNGDCKRTSKCTCSIRERTMRYEMTNRLGYDKFEHFCTQLTLNTWYEVMFESQYDYTVNCDLNYIATYRKEMFLTEHEYLIKTRKLKLQKLNQNQNE